MARYLGIGKEVTYGTPVAATDYAAIYNESLSLSQGYIRPVTVCDRAVQRRVKGPRLVQGDFTFGMHPKNLAGSGLILKALLGTETTTVLETGSAGKHEFEPGATLASLTLRAGLDAVAEKINSGCGINSLQIEQPADGILDWTCSVIGADQTKGTIGAGTCQDVDPFTAFDISTFTVGGTATTPMRFSMNVNNNMSTDHYELKTRTLPRLEPRQIKVTGEMDIRFLAATHLDDFLADTQRALVAKWEGAIIAGTTKYTFQIDLPAMGYDTADANIDRQELLVQKLKFEANETASNPIVKLTTIDNKSTAY